MNIPNAYDIELIERYLRKELEGEELDNFENSLLTNSDLAKQVEQMRALPNDLMHLEKERLSKKVKQWMLENKDTENKPITKEKPTRLFSLKIVGYAASILLLLTVSSLFLLPLFNSGLDARVQSFLEKKHESPTVLRASLNDQWSKAIQEYNEGEFGALVATMKPIIENSEATPEQLFYFALANLYLEPVQYDTALDYFDRTQKQDSLTYREEIAWYKALIFITRNDTTRAKTELNKITSSSKYGKNASLLLDELN